MRRAASTSRWRNISRASIQSQISLSVLNTGQAAIMAVGMGAVMVLTAIGIERGQFSRWAISSTGNAILMQLYQPLNLLGTVYREITQALVDMEAMFRLLYQPQEVQDKPGAKELVVTGGEIRFDNVVFSYDPERIVLKGISFTVPAGKTVAWWARPAPENPPSAAFSTASTTSKRAA